MCGAPAGWRFDGSLVEGKTKPCGEWDTGEMWECPFFVELPSSAGTYLIPPAVLALAQTFDMVSSEALKALMPYINTFGRENITWLF